MDRRADRAKAARLVRRMLIWILLGRGRLGCCQARYDGAAWQFFEVDVSARKDKLQRYGCKSEPTAPPSVSTNPTHWQNAPAPDWNSLQRSRSRAIPPLQGTVPAGINWLDCCPNVTVTAELALLFVSTDFLAPAASLQRAAQHSLCCTV